MHLDVAKLPKYNFEKLDFQSLKSFPPLPQWKG